jgi:hypothetical protein
LLDQQLWAEWLQARYLPLRMPPVFWDQGTVAGAGRVVAGE